MAELLLIRLLMLVGIVAVIYWLYKTVWGSISKQKVEHRLMKEAVEVAQSTEGKLTAADLSFATDRPLDSSENLLNRLVEEGLASAEVDNEGGLVYDIPRARKALKQNRRNLA